MKMEVREQYYETNFVSNLKETNIKLRQVYRDNSLLTAQIFHWHNFLDAKKL